MSEAQRALQAVAELAVLRSALQVVEVHRIAALHRVCAVNPETDPVRASGHRDIASLLTELWRTSLPNARQVCDVARATAPRHTLQGGVLPPEFPGLAAALFGTDPEVADSDTTDHTGNHDDENDQVGTGVAGARVSVEQVAVIVRELGKTGTGCTPEHRQMGARLLVEHAPGLTVEQVRRLAVKVRDRLDADGVEPREHLHRRRRSLTISTTPDGMTHISWVLDPESAGHVIPAITAYVNGDLHDTRNRSHRPDARDSAAAGHGADFRDSAAGHGADIRDSAAAGHGADARDSAAAGHGADTRDARDSRDARDARDGRDARDEAAAVPARVRFEQAEPEPEPASAMTGMPGMPESRSLAQLRSDAAVEVFRHRAGCTTSATSPPVTMIVRVSLADLRAGSGSAEIDGVPSPISARTARRLAADAHIIPVVLNGNSEVLDLGRKQRLFSPAQKHALAERDGGCAWTGCPHPPAYTQAHHIRWWNRDSGRTDLNNGILLCSHHHHRVHQDGWGIQIRNNIPWFTPPAHHDPTRTPRRGGRIRPPESAPR